jgi:hypothetical protein
MLSKLVQRSGQHQEINGALGFSWFQNEIPWKLSAVNLNHFAGAVGIHRIPRKGLERDRVARVKFDDIALSIVNFFEAAGQHGTIQIQHTPAEGRQSLLHIRDDIELRL